MNEYFAAGFSVGFVIGILFFAALSYLYYQIKTGGNHRR
jgi:hypothetical protein